MIIISGWVNLYSVAYGDTMMNLYFLLLDQFARYPPHLCSEISLGVTFPVLTGIGWVVARVEDVDGACPSIFIVNLILSLVPAIEDHRDSESLRPILDEEMSLFFFFFPFFLGSIMVSVGLVSMF